MVASIYSSYYPEAYAGSVNAGSNENSSINKQSFNPENIDVWGNDDYSQYSFPEGQLQSQNIWTSGNDEFSVDGIQPFSPGQTVGTAQNAGTNYNLDSFYAKADAWDKNMVTPTYPPGEHLLDVQG